MIDASRDHAPDIPSLSGKELYLFAIKMGWLNNTQIENFRNQQASELRGLNIVEFADSPLFRNHVEEIVAMQNRPGMLPESAHAAVLAERRKAEKIASQSSETNDSVSDVLAEAESAA